ncbi:PREDICTED: NF-kappa-B inhibitor beta [Thamnophis sirtalis]|uniref:NF-kappa-B inhibitor beta n=1 Tax=Thamnophis sirtalis TaxID=35019 RepID=A0A6I9XZR1_9SAUR|nr:PREDICTED: NF-kappa-B inhibitor beta [Thamnophis sirtalis]
MAFVQPGQGGPGEPKQRLETGGEEWCDSGLGSLSEGQLVQLQEDGGLGVRGDSEGGSGVCPVTSDPRAPQKSLEEEEEEEEEGRLDSALGGDEGVGDLVEGVGGVHLQSQVAPEAWLRHVLGFVTEDGDTALHLAVIHEHEAFLDSILQYTHGTDYLDIQNDLGQTALHIAVILGASSFVGKLVSAGAGLGVQEKGGHTALHLACREGWRDCAEQLLAPLANQRLSQGNRFQGQLDRANYDGYIPLHVAILRKDLDMVSLLISAGSDLNRQELSCGRSPLHLAVESQSPEIVEYLLRAGADTEARMYVGYTPMYSAMHRLDQKIPQLLREFGCEEPEWDSEESVDSNSEEEYDDIVINCGH